MFFLAHRVISPRGTWSLCGIADIEQDAPPSLPATATTDFLAPDIFDKCGRAVSAQPIHQKDPPYAPVRHVGCTSHHHHRSIRGPGPRIACPSSTSTRAQRRKSNTVQLYHGVTVACFVLMLSVQSFAVAITEHSQRGGASPSRHHGRQHDDSRYEVSSRLRSPRDVRRVG